MIWEPSAPLRGLLRTHGMNYGDCVADRSFARCESKTREGAKNCSIGFSIRSFTRFPCRLVHVVRASRQHETQSAKPTAGRHEPPLHPTVRKTIVGAPRATARKPLRPFRLN